MIRQLTKCIREYKAPTIWTLVLILAEVAVVRQKRFYLPLFYKVNLTSK